MPITTGLGSFAAGLIFYLSGVLLSVGAEIKSNPNIRGEVVLEGQIESGDYDKLINVLRTTDFDSLFLASAGGNVAESMKIGRLVRSLKMATTIPVRLSEANTARAAKRYNIQNVKANYMCASACFFVFVAGVNREREFPILDPILGVHRPYLTAAELRILTGSQAMASSGQLRVVVENYLREMGVSAKYADMMFSVSKDNIRWITDAEFKSDLEGIIPELSAWIEARCDTRTDVEKETWNMIADKTQEEMTAAEKSISELLLTKMEAIGRCESESIVELAREGHSKIFH